jgi:hypothetical protein
MDADRMIGLLQELIQAAEDPEDNGYVTAKEIAFSQDRLDLSRVDRRRLELLASRGLIEVSSVQRINMLGRPYECLGYRVSEKGLEELEE